MFCLFYYNYNFGCLEFNVPFQHKYSYIRDDIIIIKGYSVKYNSWSLSFV